MSSEFLDKLKTIYRPKDTVRPATPVEIKRVIQKGLIVAEREGVYGQKCEDVILARETEMAELAELKLRNRPRRRKH